MKSVEQREHLFALAARINELDEPLGVGLKRGCWAGVAIHAARMHSAKATEFYGLSMREIKDAIKRNNVTEPALRNELMARVTIEHALA